MEAEKEENAEKSEVGEMSGHEVVEDKPSEVLGSRYLANILDIIFLGYNIYSYSKFSVCMWLNSLNIGDERDLFLCTFYQCHFSTMLLCSSRGTHMLNP